MTSEAQSKAHKGRPIMMIGAEESEQDCPAETTALLDAGPGQDEDATTQQSLGDLEDFQGLPWWRKPTVYWLIGPYFLYTLAFGGLIVPKIELIVTLVCRHYFAEQRVLDPDQTFLPVVIGGSNIQCNSAPVQKNVAAFTLVLSALAGGLSAFTAPKLGSLSDRFGRKRLLVIASCGGIVNEAITILAAKYPDVLDYRFLILGSFFDGIAGSFTAVSVLGNSYVSDCTPPSKRAVSLGYLQACLFAGLAIGPILAGKLTVWTGSVLSIFYIALVFHVVLICFIWFVVPESLSKKRRMAAKEKYQAEQEVLQAVLSRSVESQSRLPAWIANDTIRTWLLLLFSANPLAPLKMFVPGGRENRRLRRNLLLLGFIDTILISATMGAGTVIILYAKFMFGWETLESSRFISIISFFRVIVLLVFFPIVNYFFRTRPLRNQQILEGNVRPEESHSGADNLDIWLLRFALSCDTIGVVGYVFVRTEELFIISAIFTSFGGLASATIQATLTKQVPAEHVGSMLGAMGLLHAVSRVVAPVLFDGIYAGTIESFPQTFVVVLASLFGFSIFASLFVRPYLVLSENGYAAVSEQGTGIQDGPTSVVTTDSLSESVPRV